MTATKQIILINENMFCLFHKTSYGTGKIIHLPFFNYYGNVFILYNTFKRYTLIVQLIEYTNLNQ